MGTTKPIDNLKLDSYTPSTTQAINPATETEQYAPPIENLRIDANSAPAGMAWEHWKNIPSGVNMGVFDGRGNIDFPVHPSTDVAEVRAQGQGLGSRIFNGLGRLALTTLTKAGTSAGFFAGMIEAPFKEGSFIQNAADNVLVEFFEGLEEDVKEALPIYHRRAYEQGTTFQQMGMSEFWTDEVVDGLAFMLSSIAGGYGAGLAVRGLGLSAKTARLFSTINRAAKGKKIAGPEVFKKALSISPKAKKFGDSMDRISATALMTASESMFEAKGVRDTTRDYLRGKINSATGRPYTMAEIDEIAGKNASDTFKLNMMALAISNYVEAGFLFKKSPSASMMHRLKNEGVGVVKQNLKGFRKFADGYAGRVAKGVAIGSGTEGLWEENIQYSIEKLNNASDQAKAKSDAFEGNILGEFGEAVSTLFDFKDDPRLKSIALGAIIGAPAAVVSNVKDKLRQSKRENEATSKLTEANQDLTKFDVYKKTPGKEVELSIANGQYIRREFALSEDNSKEPVLVSEKIGVDPKEFKAEAEEHNIDPEKGGKYTIGQELEIDKETNLPALDPVKVQRFVKSINKEQAIMDLLTLEQGKNRDQVLISLLQNELFAAWAYKYFAYGAADLAKERLESYKDMDPAEAAPLLGFNPEIDSRDLNAAIEQRLQQFDHLQELYESLELGLIQNSGAVETDKEFEERKEHLFDLGARNTVLENEYSRSFANQTRLEGEVKEDPEVRGINLAVAEYQALEKEFKAAVISKKSRQAVNAIKRRLTEAASKISKLKFEYNALQNKKKENGQEAKEEIDAESLESVDLAENIMMLRKLAGVRTKTSELVNMRNQLQEEWNNVSSLTTGAKYFKSDVDLTQYYFKNKPPLTENVTVNGYKSVEKSLIRTKQLEDDIRRVEEQFYGFSIVERIRQGDSIADIINDVLDIMPFMSKESYDNLVKEATQVKAEINNIRDQLTKTGILNPASEEETEWEEMVKSPEGLDPGAIEDFEEATGLSFREGVDLYNNYFNMLNSERGIEQSLEKLQDPAVKRSLVKPKTILTDDLARRQVMEDYLKDADYVISNFENNDSFQDIVSVEQELENLKNLKRIYNERRKEGGDLYGLKEYAGMTKALNSKIAQLEKIREEVLKRINEDRLQQEKVLQNATEAMFASLGIDTEVLRMTGEFVPAAGMETVWEAIQEKVSEEDLNNVLEHMKKIDPETGKPNGIGYVHAAIIMQKFVDNIKEDQEAVDKFKQHLLDLIEERSNALIPGLAPHPDKRAVNQGLVHYIKNPARGFTHLLKLGFSKTDGRVNLDHKTPDSAIYLFNKTRNPYKFQEAIAKDSLRDTEEKENLNKLFQIHVLNVGLYNLSKNLESGFNVGSHIKAEWDSISAEKERRKGTEEKEGEKLLESPANEQLFASREIAYFLNETGQENGLYDNTGYLPGPAGSGKTFVVVPWLMDVFGLTPDQILTGAANESAASTIQQSVMKDETGVGSNSIEELVTKLETADLSKVKLILVDEVGALSRDQLNNLTSALQKANKSRLDNPLKMLFLGDPNQIVEDPSIVYEEAWGAVAPIEEHTLSEDNATLSIRVKAITPLTLRFRTNIGPILDFQDLFIDQMEDITNTPIVTKATTKNPMDTSDDLYGVYGTKGNFIENTRSILKARKDTDEKRSRYVITSPDLVEEYKGQFEDELKNGTLDGVLSYVEAQGRTIDEVYVNIPATENMVVADYNKQVYTAVSRARQFIYVAGFNVETVSSDSILIDAAFRKEKVDDTINQIDALTQAELRAIHELYDGQLLSPEEIEQLYNVKDNIEEDNFENDDDEPGADDLVNDEIEDVIDPEDVEDDETPDPLEDQINDFVNRIINGELVPGQLTPEDQQFYDNNKEEIEERLRKHKELEDLKGATLNDTPLPVHPTNTALKPVKDENGNVVVPAPKPGDDVYFVTAIGRHGKVVVKVLLPVKSKGSNLYREIGQLGGDIESIPESLRPYYKQFENVIGADPATVSVEAAYPDESLGVSLIKFDSDSTGRGRDLELLYQQSIEMAMTDKFILGKGKVNRSTPLRYNYGTTYRKTNPTQIDVTFFTSYIRGSGLPIEEQDKLIHDLATGGGNYNVQFKIHSTQEAIAINSEAPADRQFLVQAGMPYLVFSDFRLPQSRAESVRTHYVRLVPRKIKHDDHIEGVGSLSLITDPKKGVIALVEKLEKAFNDPRFTLGNVEFTELYRAIADNRVDELYNAYKKSDNLVDLPELKVKLTKTIKDTAVALDKLLSARDENGERVSGPAQQVFNALAVANTQANGHLLKSYRTIPREVGKNAYIISGKNIASSGSVTTPGKNYGYTKSFNDFARKQIRKENPNFDSLTDKERADLVSKFIEGHVQEPITLNVLKEVFSFDKDGVSDTKQGFGLRLPLDMESFNQDSEYAAESTVENFDGLQPSQLDLIVELTKESQTGTRVGDDGSPSPPSPGTQTEEDEEDTSEGVFLLKDGVLEEDLGDKLTKRQARTAIKKLIPGITAEEIKFVNQAYMLRITGGKEAWGYFKDGVAYILTNPDNTIYSKVFRHEIFHRIFNMNLSEEERQVILDEARRHYNMSTYEYSDIQVEERLADEYMDWQKGKKMSIPQRILEFFKSVWRMLNFINKYPERLTELFDNIDKGVFDAHSAFQTDVNRAKLKIENDFKGGANYRAAIKWLVANINREAYGLVLPIEGEHQKKKIVKVTPKGNVVGVPKSFEEAIINVIASLAPGTGTKSESRALRDLRRQLEGTVDNYKASTLYQGVKALSNPRVLQEVLESYYPNKHISVKGVLSKQGFSFKFKDKLTEKEKNIVRSAGAAVLEDYEGFTPDELAEMRKDGGGAMEGLLDFTLSSDEINQEERVTQKVKDFFSGIMYRLAPNTPATIVPPRYVYRMLLDVFNGVVWEGDYNSQIRANMSGFKGKAQNAIKARIMDLLHDIDRRNNPNVTGTGLTGIKGYKKRVPKPVNMIFDITEDNSDVFYYAPSGMDIQNLSPYKLDKFLKDGTIKAIRKEDQANQVAYFNHIIKEAKINMSKDKWLENQMLTDLYNEYRAYQTLAELSATVNSLYEKTTYRGTVDFNRSEEAPGFMYRYFAYEHFSSKNVTVSFIENKLFKRFDNSGYVITDGLRKNIKNAKTKEEQIRALNNFYQEIGLINKNKNLEDVRFFDEGFEALKNFVSDLEDLVGKEKPPREDVDEDTINEGPAAEEEANPETATYTVGDVLRMNRSRLTAITRPYNANSLNNKAQSTRRGDGKKVYNYKKSSTGTETIQRYVKVFGGDKFASQNRTWRFAAGKVDSKGRETRADKRLPEFMRHERSDHNIFLNNQSKIRGLVDHDSIRNIMGYNDGKAVIFKNENERQWLERNFYYQFLGGMNRKGIVTGTSYIQSLYTPSNKPNIVGATVNVLKDEDIDKAIATAIDAEINRELTEEQKKVDNYQENHNKTYLPGLTKRSTKKTRKADIQKVKQALQEQADQTLDYVIDQKNLLQYPSGFKALHKKLRDKGVIPKNSKEMKGKWMPKDKQTDEWKAAFKEAMRPIFRSFYYNHYLNSLFLNKLIVGEHAFYKPGQEAYDIIKRMSIAMAEGHSGIAAPNTRFMPEKFKMAILEDVEGVVSLENFLGVSQDDPIIKKVLGEKFESTDSQGFMLPERAHELRRGMGNSVGIGEVLKPVFFEIDKYNIPRAVKYSSIVLTDELIEVIPNLGKLRDEMRNREIGEAVFKSAVKVGAPKTTTRTFNENGEFVFKNFRADSVVELSNSNYRIQLDPRHEFDAPTKNPSQLVYMMNLHGTNNEMQDKLYENIAKYIKHNKTETYHKMGLAFEQTLDKANNNKAFRESLGRNMKNIDRLSRQYEMLVSKTGDKYDVSLNNPLIAERSIIQLSNILTKEAVTMSYSGSNYVLQADYGFDIKDRPKFRDDKGYAEVYLPKIFRDNFGFTEDQFLSKDDIPITMVGFRIPSTELHSAIPLKIKGFLDTDENIIIAPREIVFFHGSDYDVDKLYMIREQLFDDADPSTGKLLGIRPNRKGELLLKNEKGKVIARLGKVLGKDDKGNPLTIRLEWKKDENGKSVALPATQALEEELSHVKDLINKNNLNKGVRKKLINYKAELNHLYNAFLRNEIVNIFDEVIRADRNREFMLYPISMGRFNRKSKGKGDQTIFNMLKKLGVEVQPKRDLNQVMDQMAMKQDNALGAAMVGKVANMLKGAAYIHAASRDPQGKRVPPVLKEGKEVTIGGHVYNALSITEKDKKDPTKDASIKLFNGSAHTPSTWETLDSLINAALDNVKEQILPTINFNHITASGYLAGVMMGIPLETLVKLMKQPALVSIAKGETSSLKIRQQLAKIIDENIEITANTKPPLDTKEYAFTDENLDNLITKDITQLTPEEAKQMYKVLETFSTLNSIGNSIDNTSKVVDVINGLPVNHAGMTELKRNYGRIYKKDNTLKTGETGYMFPTADLRANLPHFREAWKLFTEMKTKVENIFKVHNKALINFSASIDNLFAPDAARVMYANENADTAQAMFREKIRKDFMRYLLSGTTANIDGNIVNFKTYKEDSYDYVANNGKTYTLHGADAWIEKFIDKVEYIQSQEALKPEEERNQFIINLNIRHRDNKRFSLRSISFPQMMHADLVDMTMYLEDFEKLLNMGVAYDRAKESYSIYERNEPTGYSQLQVDFLKYAVLTEGLEFGSKNFSLALPIKLIGKFSDSFDAKINQYLSRRDPKTGISSSKENAKLLNAVGDHFILQFVRNYPELLVKSPGQISPSKEATKTKKAVYKGIDKLGNTRIRYDKRYVLPEENGYKDFPLLISNRYDEVFLMVPLPKEAAEKTKHVYYKKLAGKTNLTYYQEDARLLEAYKQGLEYKFENLLDPTIDTVTADINVDKKIAVASDLKYFPIHLREKGKKVLVKDPADSNRLDTYYGTVKTVTENDVTITLDTKKEVFSKPPKRAKNKTDENLDPTKEDTKHQFDSDQPVLSNKALNYLLNKLSTQFNIDYRFVEGPVKGWKARFHNGIVEINSNAVIRVDTPFHEFLHPFVALIKEQNPVVYKNLRNQVEASQEGKALIDRLLADPRYADQITNYEDAVEEAMVTLLGQMAGRNIQPATGGVLFEALDRAWKAILALLKQLIGVNFVASTSILTVDNLTTDVSLQDIADMVSLSNVRFQAARSEFSTPRITPNVMDARIDMYATTRTMYSMGDPEAEVERDFVQKENPDYINQLNSYNNSIGLSLAADRENYRSDTDNFQRLTYFAAEAFSNTPTTEDRAKVAASAMYRDKKLPETELYPLVETSPTTGEQTTKHLTYDQLVDYKLIDFNTAAAYGNLGHKLMQSWVTKDENKKVEFSREADQIAEAKPGKQKAINRQWFDWAKKNLYTIMDKVGVKLEHIEQMRYPTAKVPNEDHVATEIMISNKDLGVATTIDMLVQHANGEMSIIDWKAGTKFYNDQRYIAGLMNYGKQFKHIDDTRLDMAKMEVVLRAVMLKAQFPDVKFKNLLVAHLNRRDIVVRHEIDLDSFLGAIHGYLKDNNAELAKEWETKGLFDSRSYGGNKMFDITSLSDKETGKTRDELVEMYSNELRDIQARYPNEEQRPPEIKKRIGQLVVTLTDLKKQPGEVTSLDEADMGWWRRWTGGLQDAKNKYVQIWGRALFERKHKARQQMLEINDQHDLLLRKALDSVGIEHETKRKEVVGHNYQDTFGWVWEEKTTRTGEQGMFLVTESSKKWIQLTKEQQAYIRFIRDTMNEQWQKTMDVPDHRDPHTKKMMRKYQFSRMNQATLPEDFMPRVGMDQGEFLERHGLIKGLREGTFSKWHKYRSQFLEEYQYVYKNQDLPNGVRLSGAAGKVPIRYIGSEDIIGDQLHTMSAEIAFKKFIDNLITKRELDDIVEWGAGLRTFMTFDANSPDQFKGYSKFVKDQILIQIFGGKQKFQLTSKPIVIKTKDKTYTINQDQILRGLKYWSTITSMWLKPIQGTFNHALIIMLDTKDALKGTIARAVGVPPENIDFTMKDLHRAEMEVFKLWKDQALGNQRENKLYNLAYKFQYLTDSYDYTIFRENLVAGGSKFFRESKMYWFHTIGEDHGNYSLLAAQLMHMKHPKTGESIWDSYDDYGNWNAPSRGVTVDPGTGETTELNELDSREITKLKRVSQRIHGSYRQEERSALELYALGQWLLQFKRYMPQLLNNLFQGGYKDSTAGYYKQVFDANGKPKRIDGEDVFEFSERMQRGRLWVMLEILGSLWGKGRAFNDMDPEEQQQFIDLMMTATLMLSYGTYVMTGYKDDDEKFWSTNFGMRLNRLIVEDLTQNVNPMDAGRNLVTPLITVSKLYNGMQALGSFLVDGLILGDRTQQGRIPGETTVRKYIPVLSMFAEFEKYIGNAQEAGVLEEDGGILDRLQKAAEFSRIR